MIPAVICHVIVRRRREVSGAAWDIDALGLVVARLVVTYLVPAGASATVAIDGTSFRRWGGGHECFSVVVIVTALISGGALVAERG